MSIRIRTELSQKGFIVAPIVWWVLGAVLVTSVAVKEGAISIQYPPNAQETTVNVPSPSPSFADLYKPTPTPTSTPTPTLKPLPQGQVQGATHTNQNAQKPKYDGTRTGRIIDYKSFCEGKTIRIYENELVSYKLANGQTTYITKGDIKCYEDKINQLINDTYGRQNTDYQTPHLPPYKPLTFNIPPPPKIEPYVPQYTSPTFTVDPPLVIQVEPEPCVVVPPGFGGATSGRVNEAGFSCAN